MVLNGPNSYGNWSHFITIENNRASRDIFPILKWL